MALKGFEKLGNKSGQSFCYNNISNCYYQKNRFTEAIPYLNKSVKLKKELGDKRGLSNAEQNLGNNYMGLEDWAKTEKHFKNAIALNQNFPKPWTFDEGSENNPLELQHGKGWTANKWVEFKISSKESKAKFGIRVDAVEFDTTFNPIF